MSASNVDIAIVYFRGMNLEEALEPRPGLP